MEKITNYMRATKKRKTTESDVKAASLSKSLVVENGGVVPKSLAPPRAQGMASSSSTLKRPKTDSAITMDDDGEIYEHGIHIPAFIFHAVNYERKGEPRTVCTKTQRVVDYVQSHYEIPQDFETSYAFGPHSGMSYESRLLRAYKLKLLSPKSTSPSPAGICINCTRIGHADRDCPDGF